MAYYKVRFEVWCDWNPAESDLDDIAQSIGVGEAICTTCILPNTACSVFGVVETFSSRSICPLWSRTQYQLDRSPRSKPMVSFSPATFSLVGVPAVLIFSLPVSFISCAFERVYNLGAYRIPSETGLLIPSVYNSYDYVPFWPDT